MSEKTEITFMQTRLIRLASEEWNLPIDKIIDLFKSVDTEFLEGKGMKINA